MRLRTETGLGEERVMFDNIRIISLLATIVCAIACICHATNGDIPSMCLFLVLAMANAFLIRRD